jgi:hypothetical protein
MLPVTSAPIGSRRAAVPAGRQRRAIAVSAARVGAVGFTRSTMPASAGMRSPLRWLQPSQQATVLAQLFRPPRERGRTWSTVVAAPAQ